MQKVNSPQGSWKVSRTVSGTHQGPISAPLAIVAVVVKRTYLNDSRLGLLK